MKNQNTLLILLALTMIVLLLSSFLLNIYLMLGCEIIALSIITLFIGTIVACIVFDEILQKNIRNNGN